MIPPSSFVAPKVQGIIVFKWSSGKMIFFFHVFVIIPYFEPLAFILGINF
jgi:hypothetical protein